MIMGFEDQVRQRILDCGVNYAQLGAEAGVSGSQIGRYMAGERSLTSETLGRILDVLGVGLGPQTRQIVAKPMGRPRKPVFINITDASLEPNKEPVDINKVLMELDRMRSEVAKLKPGADR
jgi:transcriptional regulator with XRE-family HTH domain